ncbi:MAG: ATP-binding cassette domain-containing protein, partial [Pseudomonadota bacterium]|nr:ATP-binding cassette domain-containing protein [Pseudomonadota bacterium]
LNPLQTIGQQVAETIRIHDGASPQQALEQAEAVLAQCELPAAQVPMSRYPHQLSGGQRQRVVIAMAIAMRPRLLIADEPTTALDVTTQAEILALLQRLVAGEGMALMLITHDLAVAASLADRILVMHDGAVVEQAPTPALLKARAHPHTQLLFDATDHCPDRQPAPTAAQTPAVGPLLRVQDVVQEYRLPRPHPLTGSPVRRAVDGVSLEIEQGRCLALVGESGSGKSTLARAILGLEPIREGQIALGGRDVFADAGARAGMQAVFQDPYGSFNPRWRVSRLIAEPFFRLGRAAREEEIDEALVSVGLAPADKHKHIHAFSGGQRQRLALARALITRPELIILDEAVSAL